LSHNQDHWHDQQTIKAHPIRQFPNVTWRWEFNRPIELIPLLCPTTTIVCHASILSANSAGEYGASRPVLLGPGELLAQGHIFQRDGPYGFTVCPHDRQFQSLRHAAILARGGKGASVEVISEAMEPRGMVSISHSCH